MSECESVFVALGIQHAVRMRRIVICGLSDCTILFHIMSLGTYCESVFVALSIQHAVRMRCIVICGLSDCIILFHIMS